jgi:hypothetical protein
MLVTLWLLVGVVVVLDGQVGVEQVVIKQAQHL